MLGQPAVDPQGQPAVDPQVSQRLTLGQTCCLAAQICPINNQTEPVKSAGQLSGTDIDLGVRRPVMNRHVLLRKEVIQPHLPIRLPCYDFTPIICPTFGSALLAVKLLTSGVTDSHGVTGGVYKARERIHGSMLTCHY